MQTFFLYEIVPPGNIAAGIARLQEDIYRTYGLHAQIALGAVIPLAWTVRGDYGLFRDGKVLIQRKLTTGGIGKRGSFLYHEVLGTGEILENVQGIERCGPFEPFNGFPLAYTAESPGAADIDLSRIPVSETSWKRSTLRLSRIECGEGHGWWKSVKKTHLQSTTVLTLVRK